MTEFNAMLKKAKEKSGLSKTSSAEKAPLLSPWKDETGERGGYRNSWAIFFGLLKHTLMHVTLFAIFSIVFMLGWHKIPNTLFWISFILVTAFLLDSAYIFTTRGRVTPYCLGLCMCGFAIFAGSVAGITIHMSILVDYWPYYQKRHYTNVSPDESAASHADASVLVFMDGARPDPSRSSQYKRYYHTYCVAPVALESGYSDDMTVSSNIQYWAIGMDCCGGAEGFNCGDAQNPKARTGLVKVRRKEEDKILKGILSNEYMSYFEKAVLMTESKFDLTSPEDRIYVKFVEDIWKARWEMWTDAWWSWFTYQSLFFVIWFAIGILTVFVGTGDPEDSNKYGDHLIDAKQNILLSLNHYI